MKKKLSPYEKELERLGREERKFLQKYSGKNSSALDRLLEEKLPEKLRGTLDAAFAKAFALVFEKGSGLIEKTCRREEKEKQYKIDEYTARVRGDRRSLRQISKKAGGAGRLNTAISGAAGLGLGFFGIGIPDIALFTALMLKNIYEIALRYGFEYESEGERAFILRLIRAAVSRGEELERLDEELNRFIAEGSFSEDLGRDELIKLAAGGLSGELLYMKFLQGLPVVGAAGGAYDAVYMQRISKYAELKYRRRFYFKY